MSARDPVTHNQIHHIHNLTPLVTNTFWVAALGHMMWQFNNNLVVLYKPLAKLCYLFQLWHILKLCCAESFWGWSAMTQSDWSIYQAHCAVPKGLLYALFSSLLLSSFCCLSICKFTWRRQNSFVESAPVFCNFVSLSYICEYSFQVLFCCVIYVKGAESSRSSYWPQRIWFKSVWIWSELLSFVFQNVAVFAWQCIIMCHDREQASRKMCVCVWAHACMCVFAHGHLYECQSVQGEILFALPQSTRN